MKAGRDPGSSWLAAEYDVYSMQMPLGMLLL